MTLAIALSDTIYCERMLAATLVVMAAPETGVVVQQLALEVMCHTTAANQKALA